MLTIIIDKMYLETPGFLFDAKNTAIRALTWFNTDRDIHILIQIQTKRTKIVDTSFPGNITFLQASFLHIKREIVISTMTFKHLYGPGAKVKP